MNKYKRIFLSLPHMGSEELNFVKEAFESNYIAPVGPMVDAFEREFAEKVGIAYTATVSKGKAGMHLGFEKVKIAYFTTAKHNTLKEAAADYE